MAVSIGSMIIFCFFVAIKIVFISSQDPSAPPPPAPAALAALAGAPATGITPPIPDSKFTCTGQKYGYYADMDLGCTIFHVCWNDLKWSFWCPPGTLFNQHNLVCDHDKNVDCKKSGDYLWVNDNFFTSKQFLQQRR